MCFTNYVVLKYILTKKDAKPRLLRWILLLQEFDISIKDKKAIENVVADHLSRLVVNHNIEDPTPIKDMFPDEHLFAISTLPWYTDLVDRRKLEVEARSFFFDEPYMFKYCADQIIPSLRP